MNIWNRKNLPVPPINTYKTTTKNIDIKHLFNVVQEGKQFFDNNKYMYAEYLVLSRIVYRMKQKFRTAKDFKALEKVNKALDNYFEIGILSNITNFMNLIPSRYKEETYLPTKNMLDYILVRLQGLVKLMERIVETSKIAAYLLDKRIRTGQFWKIAFIIFALVSRVHVLAKYTAKFICEFYRKLVPFSHQLKNTAQDWLPQSYDLPQDLKEWMNVDWLEFDDEIQIVEVPTKIPDIMQFFDLVNDDDDSDDIQFYDEYFLVDDEDVEIVREFRKHCSVAKSAFTDNSAELRGFDNREDVGEVIEINDNTFDENLFSQNVERTVNDSEINIISDTDESHVISILDDTSLSYLRQNNVNSPVDIGMNFNNLLLTSQQENSIILKETDEENVITVSDVSLLDVTDEVNNMEKLLTKTDKGELISNGDYVNGFNNSSFVSESECELVILETDGEVIEIVSDPSLIEIEDVQDTKKKKKLKKKNKNGNKLLEGNSKLLHMKNNRTGENTDTDFLLDSRLEDDNAAIRSATESVTLSHNSVAEVPNVKPVRKKKKLKKNYKSSSESSNLKLLQEENNRVHNRRTNDNSLSPNNDNLNVKSSEDVVVATDTSLMENRVVKKKKLKTSVYKNDNNIKSKSKTDLNPSLILNSIQSNIITKSPEKNVTTVTNTPLTEEIKKKKKKLKRKLQSSTTLENTFNKNSRKKTKIDTQFSLISDENYDNMVFKPSEKYDRPISSLTRPTHDKKMEKKKNKLKKNETVSKMENQFHFEKDITAHSSPLLVLGRKNSDMLSKKREFVPDTSLEGTLCNRILKKKKNKKNKFINNDTVTESNENIRNENEFAKIKANKFKKGTTNVTKLDDKFKESNTKRVKLHTGILLSSQTQNNESKKLTKKYEENITSPLLQKRKKSKKRKEINSLIDSNNKNNLSSEVTNHEKKVVNSLQTKLSKELIKNKELNSTINLHNKSRKGHRHDKIDNRFVNVLSASSVNSSRKRKLDIEDLPELKYNKKFVEKESHLMSTRKKQKRERSFNKSESLGEASTKQETRSNSTTCKQTKLDRRKKKKLNILNKLEQSTPKNISRFKKIIGKLKKK